LTPISPDEQGPGWAGAESLADALSHGPPPVATALNWAAAVAQVLQQLHHEGRAHGGVAARNVLLLGSGVQLRSSPDTRSEASFERDVHGFGTILYEVLTGKPVPQGAATSLFLPAGAVRGLAEVHASGLKLAGRCLGHLPVRPSMQQAATETRLLCVLARQVESEGPRPYQPPAGVAQPAPAVAESQPESVAPAIFAPMPAKVGRQPLESTCPQCGSKLVYASRARSGFERLLLKLDIPICRCHRCYHRYLEVAKIRIAKEAPPAGPSLRRKAPQ